MGELVAGILDEVGAILTSLSSGPEDPKGPVRDENALKQDSARLDAATHKAAQLANELSRLQNQTDERGR